MGDSQAQYGYHTRKNESDGTEIAIRNNRHSNRHVLDSDQEDLRYYGFAYSKARSGFLTQQIKSTTIQQLDSEKYENDSKDDFHQSSN